MPCAIFNGRNIKNRELALARILKIFSIYHFLPSSQAEKKFSKKLEASSIKDEFVAVTTTIGIKIKINITIKRCLFENFSILFY